jgi:hypothetical protein
MICLICKTEYFRETQLEPASECLCGEMAFGNSLWQWDRHRAIIKRFRYWLNNNLFKLSAWIIKDK